MTFLGGEGGGEGAIFKQEHFAVVTKNSNWEIFSKNLVTFKR